MSHAATRAARPRLLDRLAKLWHRRARRSRTRYVVVGSRSGWLQQWADRISPLRRRREAREAARREAFASRLLRQLRQLSRAGSYIYDPEVFALRQMESASMLRLGRGYARYQRADDREQEREVLQELAREAYVPPLPASLSAARPDLVLSTQSRAAYALGSLAGSQEIPAVLPMGPSLVHALFYKRSNGSSAVTPTRLEAWGCTPADAFAAARENLRERAPVELSDGPRGVLLARSPEAVLPDIDACLRDVELEGDPVVIPISSMLALVGGSGETRTLREMIQVARRCRSSIACHAALVRTPEGWRRFRPAEPALASLFRELEIAHEVRDFARQKSLLDAIYRSRGLEMQVPEVVARRDEAGPFTLFRWEGSGEALLPTTDRVELTSGPGGSSRLLAWEEVIEALEDPSPEPDLYPPRIRVSGTALLDGLCRASAAPRASA